MKVLHIDLWKCYLSYVRETKGKLPSYKYVISVPYVKTECKRTQDISLLLTAYWRSIAMYSIWILITAYVYQGKDGTGVWFCPGQNRYGDHVIPGECLFGCRVLIFKKYIYFLYHWCHTCMFCCLCRFGWTTLTFSKECKYATLKGKPLLLYYYNFFCCCCSARFDLSGLYYSEAVGSYAENQRITAVRRVYQRGCVNPMINIEQLWRDYSKYEEVRGR